MGKLTEEHGCTGQPLQKHSQLAGCAEASQLRCFQDGVFFFLLQEPGSPQYQSTQH